MARDRRGRPRTVDSTQEMNNQRGKFQITWDPGEANEKQKRFFEARTTFIAYGGAKGGGKTWAVRTKAVGGAIFNPGIKILIMRRTYPELEENHIQPIVSSVNQSIASYNASLRLMTFFNGSTIKFGHWSGEQSESEYQGMEFDWIFIDEATQFTERAFNYLKGCLRGVRGQEVGGYPKRMYLTCNPGGVGHRWVKRLFIDRDYIHDPDNPEGWEDPGDYTFIPATVEDNKVLLESSPQYVKMLAQMPENVRRAYRYGDWDALGGSYFPEFRLDRHVCAPFRIPAHWTRYRTIDYGLDMLAVYWVAVDEHGRSWVYREYTQPAHCPGRGPGDPGPNHAGREDRGDLRAAGPVEHPEGHGAHHGGDLHDLRGVAGEGQQQPGTGAHDDQGSAGAHGGREAGADGLQVLQESHQRYPGYPGG